MSVLDEPAPGYHAIRAKSPAFQQMMRIAARDGWVCWYCGIPLCHSDEHVRRHRSSGGVFAVEGFRFPQRDHQIPRSRGGSDDDANIVLACCFCNSAKRERTPEEFEAAA